MKNSKNLETSETRCDVLFAAFDAYPGLKGAQAHIRTNLCSLASSGRRVTLLCLGRESFRDPETGALVHGFESDEQNLLRRSELFGRFLSKQVDGMLTAPPAIIHFRDVWSGVPLLSHSQSRKSRLIFEVNGLPSVELPDHFPRLLRNRSLIGRLRRMEEDCLALSDRVITVCRVTARYLVKRGCPEEKISIIPNAARVPDCLPGLPAEADSPENLIPLRKKIILYVGTLAPWQGLPVLLEAISLLRHRDDFHLVIAASGKKGVRRLQRLVQARSLGDRVSILDGIHHSEMPSLYARSYLSVAPLSRGARNELQGCSPLKIIESMANGTPVVAADLPVVRELVESGKSGWLVTPESSRALASAMEAILVDGATRQGLSAGAYERARRDFGTELFTERLNTVYENLTGGKQ